MPELPADHPLKVIEKLDPQLFKSLMQNRDFMTAETALPQRYKLLVALALDASHGSVDGVTRLAQAALGCGATKEEIMEVLRIAGYISGAGAIYTAARALKGVL